MIFHLAGQQPRLDLHALFKLSECFLIERLPGEIEHVTDMSLFLEKLFVSLAHLPILVQVAFLVPRDAHSEADVAWWL